MRFVNGPSGASGVSGIPGSVAFSGVSGAAGASGGSGPSGEQGVSGVSGASGASGASGVPLIAYNQAKDTTTGTTVTGGSGVANIANLTEKKSNNLSYNSSTGIWTIGVSGLYTMTATCFTTSSPGTATLSFTWAGGTESVTAPFVAASGGSNYYATVSATAYNAASSTVGLLVINSTTATFFTSCASITLVTEP